MLITIIFSYLENFFVLAYLAFYFILNSGAGARDNSGLRVLHPSLCKHPTSSKWIMVTAGNLYHWSSLNTRVVT